MPSAWSSSLPPGRLRYSFHAHCTEGLVELRFSAGKLLAHTATGEELLAEDRATKATTAELAHFLECVRTGTRPLTDGRGSLQGLRVIWRLYEAEEAGTLADLAGLGLGECSDPPSAPLDTAESR